MNPDLTPEAFKQKIITKYPNGVASDGTPYSKMDAADLTRRIVDKYPNGVTTEGTRYADYLPKENAAIQPNKSAHEDSLLSRGLKAAFPILQRKERTRGQLAGDIALSALPLVPLAGVGGSIAARAGAGVVGRVAENAALGYAAGSASRLSEGDDVKTALAPNANNLTGAGVGGLTSGLLGRVTGGAKPLRAAAEKDIADILSPTTKKNKQLTQKIAPRLAKETPFAMNRESLLQKYEDKLGKVGEDLEAEYDKLPDDARFEVSDLFDTLNKRIDDLTINGTVPSAAKAKVDAYQDMMKDLAQIGVQVSDDGQQVFANVRGIRKLRQILDQGKRNFSFTDFDSARQEAQKTLANTIRSEFGKQHPDINTLNKEFNFWSNAIEVLSSAVERKTGQSGIVRKGIAAGLGMGVGAPAGHPLIAAGMSKLLADFVASPAWNTTTARVKSKIADAFEAGNYKAAGKLMQKAIETIPVAASLGVQGLVDTVIPQTLRR